MSFNPSIYQKNYHELNPKEQFLIDKAKEATLLSYAPYSNFRVGCAIQLRSDQIIIGANQENAAFPMCICAEVNALSTVSSQYASHTIESIAVYADMNGILSPCGQCRQVLWEYENRMNALFSYYLVSNSEIYYFHGIENILPLPFQLKHLNKI